MNKYTDAGPYHTKQFCSNKTMITRETWTSVKLELMLLNWLSWAVYEICSTQKKNLDAGLHR